MDAAYLTERITKTKAIISAYEDAILALGVAGGIESYTLDTGQARQVVTRYDLDKLNQTLGSLYNRLCVFQSRLTGGGVTIARPAW